MTPEERQMLIDLGNKVAQTPAPARDPEADEFIRTHIGSRPDALYIMTQTVMIQNMALDHARQQIQELQQRAAPASSSVLGGARPPENPPQGYAPPAPGGISSFLHSAMTTAAGVAAGALAFEGIRSLFGGGGGGGFGGFGGGMHGGSFLAGAPGSETIVNNYYDSPPQSADDSSADTDADADASDDSAQSADDTSDYSDDSGDTSSGDDSA